MKLPRAELCDWGLVRGSMSFFGNDMGVSIVVARNIQHSSHELLKSSDLTIKAFCDP